MANRYLSGYIQRQHLSAYLEETLSRHMSTPVEPGENETYRLGHALGYTDGLQFALRVLSELPDDPKPEQRIILGRPETYPR